MTCVGGYELRSSTPARTITAKQTVLAVAFSRKRERRVGDHLSAVAHESLHQFNEICPLPSVYSCGTLHDPGSCGHRNVRVARNARAGEAGKGGGNGIVEDAVLRRRQQDGLGSAGGDRTGEADVARELDGGFSESVHLDLRIENARLDLPEGRQW